MKVLNPRFVEDEAAQMRFRREAKAAGRLQHANAVAVTDFGQTAEGYVYIVMELLEGRTLRDDCCEGSPTGYCSCRGAHAANGGGSGCSS